MAPEHCRLTDPQQGLSFTKQLSWHLRNSPGIRETEPNGLEDPGTSTTAPVHPQQQRLNPKEDTLVLSFFLQTGVEQGKVGPCLKPAKAAPSALWPSAYSTTIAGLPSLYTTSDGNIILKTFRGFSCLPKLNVEKQAAFPQAQRPSCPSRK